MKNTENQGATFRRFVDNYVSQRMKKDGYYTQSMLADEVGIARNTLQTYYSREKLRPTTIEKIEKALDLRPGYILSMEWEGTTQLSNAAEGTPLYNFVGAANNLNVLFNDNPHVVDYLKIPGTGRLDGAIFVSGDSMYPLLKSGDIIAYKRVALEDIFMGEMYILSYALSDGEIMTSIKFVQKSELGPEHLKLVSENRHHAPKDILAKNVTAIAHVRAQVRVNTI